MKPLLQLGKRQRAALEHVWGNAEATVQGVREDLNASGVPLAYTTVLTVMQNLERAGWLIHRREGRRYLYAATMPRKEALLEAAERFARECDGDDGVEFARHVLRCCTHRNRPLTMLDRLSRRRVAS